MTVETGKQALALFREPLLRWLEREAGEGFPLLRRVPSSEVQLTVDLILRRQLSIPDLQREVDQYFARFADDSARISAMPMEGSHGNSTNLKERLLWENPWKYHSLEVQRLAYEAIRVPTAHRSQVAAKLAERFAQVPDDVFLRMNGVVPLRKTVVRKTAIAFLKESLEAVEDPQGSAMEGVMVALPGGVYRQKLWMVPGTKGLGLECRSLLFKGNVRLTDFVPIRELRIGGPVWDQVDQRNLPEALDCIAELARFTQSVLADWH